MCGASQVPPSGDLARNPGMCPDWELDQRPFGSQASTKSTEPHQVGLTRFLKIPQKQEGWRYLRILRDLKRKGSIF